MSFAEAWTVTGLGITVTFLGLLLCIAFIQLFNRLASRFGDPEHPAPATAEAPPSPPGLPAEPLAAVPTAAPIDAGVLAVIAAVIEVERTLYLGPLDARLTIRRSGLQP